MDHFRVGFRSASSAFIRGSPVALTSRMITPLRMTFQLCRIKVNFAQISRGISLHLIVKMRRRRIAALAAGGDSLRAHRLSKFNNGNEAVAARAINLLR